MFDQVYGWLQNIAAYLVVVTAVMHAIPGKDYEKYIRFFSGLVLIVLLFMPVLSVFGMKETFGTIKNDQSEKKEREMLEEAGRSYEEMLENYISYEEDEKTEAVNNLRTDRETESADRR